MLNLARRRSSAAIASRRKSISQQKTLILNLRTNVFIPKPFSSMNMDRCVNLLVYGTPIKKITKNGGGKPHYVFFYLFEDDMTQLQWISNFKSMRDSRIDLKTVTTISEIPTGAKRKKIEKYDGTLFLSILYGANEELLLLFDNENTKKEWWCGLQYFVERAQAEQNLMFQETSNALAQEIFARADSDGSRSLNKNEIKQILKDMQINMKNKQINDIIDKYDNDKNGKIEFEEFRVLVKELLRKEELVPIFKKYTIGWLRDNYSFPAMTLLELLRFFQEEQKQELTLEEIRNLNKAFKDVSPVKPCISFDLFNDLLFSLLNTIFKVENSIRYQDMTRPLTDYYVNSSHNTYLMANQLTGESSVQAYINALLKGCRCVELDLWNGPNGEPIIYHGHTMTSKIFFKDVIVALKEHAFKINQYPLILSFEMHCDLKSQQKIAEILKSEIGDMIYKIPEDSDKYDYYPSPDSLKNKFIIKGKGKLVNKHDPREYLVVSPNRLSVDNRTMTPGKFDLGLGSHLSVLDSSVESQTFDNSSPIKNGFDTVGDDDDASQIKLRYNNKGGFVDDEDGVVLKTKNFASAILSRGNLTVHKPNFKEDNIEISIQSTIRGGSQQSLNTHYPRVKKDSDEDYIGEEESHDLSSKIQLLGMNQYFLNRPGQPGHMISIGNSEKTSDSPKHTIDKVLNGSINHVKQSSFASRMAEKRTSKKIKVLPELNGFYAMIGKKMDFLSTRKIWEISSLHEGKILKYYKNRHKNIVDFHKKFLSRIYPTASRIDSSNFDPIIPWASGSQLVALNFQTSDESMILNYAKFVANGGIGYVLKPKYLCHNTLLNPDLACYPSDMKTPVKKLIIKVISGQQIRPDKFKCKEIIDPYVEVKLRGLEIDEQNNQTFRTQTVKDNGFHPVWSTKGISCTFEFNICAPDFCILVFNVYDEDIVGRDKIGWYAVEFNNIQQGYRVVPVLNSLFQPIKHSYIFCHISIVNL